MDISSWLSELIIKNSYLSKYLQQPFCQAIKILF